VMKKVAIAHIFYERRNRDIDDLALSRDNVFGRLTYGRLGLGGSWRR
jgi:hypothetical protein